MKKTKLISLFWKNTDVIGTSLGVAIERLYFKTNIAYNNSKYRWYDQTYRKSFEYDSEKTKRTINRQDF